MQYVCKDHKFSLETPRLRPGHKCPRGCELKSYVPPAPEDFEQFDHTFTPEQAWFILASIPADSYHWADIERIDGGRRRRFTRLMRAGEWVPETLASGHYQHPVRWDENGQVSHGVLRLLACRDSGRPFTTAVQCPTGHFAEAVGF